MATMLQVQRPCPTCNAPRLFEKPGINNLAHALVTLFLCGLWFPVWLIASALNTLSPYRCSMCGHAYGGGLIPAMLKGGIALLLMVALVSAISSRSTGESPDRLSSGTTGPVGVRPVERKSMEAPTLISQPAAAVYTPTNTPPRPGISSAAAATLKHYTAQAEKNDSFAQLRLGQLYMRGENGVPRDLVKAREYLLQAAMNGRQEAQTLLEKLKAEQNRK